MKSLMVIARHDLRMALRDRAAVIWMFLLPAVFATFFGLVMGGGNPADAKATLTVDDRDGSALSRTFVADLKGARLSLRDAADPTSGGEAAQVRTLVIPSGFGTRVTAGEKVTLRLETDPGSSMEAGMVAQARILDAITRLLGRLVEASQHGEVNEAAILGARLAPELVHVNVREAGRGPTIPSGFSQSVPGNATMFVMMVALTYGAASLAAERHGGLLRRLATTPVGPRAIVLGKIAGRFVIAAVQIVVLVAMAALARAGLGIDLGGSLVDLLVVLLVYALAVAPLGVLFGALLKDPEHGAGFGVLATLVMAAFGGCWWPIEVVSPTLQHVAMLLPTGWTMMALHQVTSFGHGLGAVLPHLGILLGYSVLFSALAVRSFRVS